MIRVFLTILSFILLVSFQHTYNPTKTFHRKSGKIEIRLEKYNSKSGTKPGPYNPSGDSIFLVVIKNNTDTIASFYEDWNSWGYYNFYFKIICSDTSFVIYRPDKDFTKNFPSFKSLNPGDSMTTIFPVNFYQFSNKYDWFKKIAYLNSKIVACYQLNERVHEFETFYYPYFGRNYNDSIKAIKVYQSFPLNKFESTEKYCTIKDGIIFIWN